MASGSVTLTVRATLTILRNRPVVERKYYTTLAKYEFGPRNSHRESVVCDIFTAP